MLRFTKMHGIGNDYIYFDCTRAEASSGIPQDILNNNDKLASLSRILSDRHTGIGGDGIILILPSQTADFMMRIFNADGSEAQMCGNGSRCVGKFLVDKKLTTNSTIKLETLAGIKLLHTHIGSDGTVDTVNVDMGPAFTEPAKIPVVAPGQTDGWNIAVRLDDQAFQINAVSMGNPHGVVFVDNITDQLVHKIGPMLETHNIWPEKANIEFACIIDPHNVEMRVWERGSGETMACGTGACATAVAAVATQQCQWPITIHLLGGDLTINQDPDSSNILMEGSATEVFTGTMTLPNI